MLFRSFTNVDNAGVAGLELKYDDLLTGENGVVLTAVHAWGYTLEQSYETERFPTEGDVYKRQVSTASRPISGLEVMLMITPCAPAMLVSSSGEEIEALAAFSDVYKRQAAGSPLRWENARSHSSAPVCSPRR